MKIEERHYPYVCFAHKYSFSEIFSLTTHEYILSEVYILLPVAGYIHISISWMAKLSPKSLNIKYTALLLYTALRDFPQLA